MSTSSLLVMRDASGLALNERCETLKHPGSISLIVSIVLLLGILISYLPQHYRIISRGTSEGISPYFVLLGVTSATSAFANIVTLPASRDDIACCREIGTFECVAGLLGIAQLGIQWLCFAFILTLFLVFFRLDEATVPHEELDYEHEPKWQTALTVAWICFLHAVIVVAVSVTIGLSSPQNLSSWANILGLSASSLAVVQYAPQIWTTYQLKHVGSLSIPMMCIQTPGGFLFAGSLYYRLGPSGWSSWGLFLLTACAQGILLCLAIYYEVAQRRRRNTAAIAADDNTDQVPRPLPRSRACSPTTRPGHSPVRIDHRIYGQNGAYDDDMPGPYTGHPGNYADTPEEYETLMSREDSQAAAEDSPLLRRGGIGDPRRNDAEWRE